MSLETLIAAFPSAIARMPDSFDSHAFLLKLAKHNQCAYVQALAEEIETGSETPFQALHSRICKALSRSGLMEKDGRTTSKDIFRRTKSEVQCWRKRADAPRVRRFGPDLSLS